MLSLALSSAPVLGPAVLGAAILGTPVLGDDSTNWPDFRGPDQSGRIAGETSLPLHWSEERNVRWKTEIHGLGHSSPVVWEDQIWLTTATPEGRELSVLCVDRDEGDVLHDFVLFEVEAPEFRNALNSYASPSPVIDEGRVWVHFGTYGTACIDTDSGAPVWERRDINCEHLMGPGSSPVLCGDTLVLTIDGADVQFMIGLDRDTGETRWRSDRSTDFSDVVPDMQKAYGTPLLTTRDGAPHLVSSSAQCGFGHDPRTGEELWRLPFKGFSMSARPLEGQGLYILNTGFMKAALVAVPADGEGDLSERIAWRYDKNVATMSTGVVVDDLLFMVDDGGIATCLELDSGERLWRERIDGRHCASPLAAGDRVYFFDREGQSTVLRASREFEVLARNQLESGFMASPAVVGDSFVLRTAKHLYRIEGHEGVAADGR